MAPDKLGTQDSHLQGEKVTERAKANLNNKRRYTYCFSFWILTLLSCLLLVAINPSALFAHHNHSIDHLSELARLYPFRLPPNSTIIDTASGSSSLVTPAFIDQVQFDKYSLILRGQRVFLQ